MEKTYCLYMHTNILNNKKYIGITSMDPPEKRWGTNGKRYEGSAHFYAAIQKYGWDNFKHEILFTNLTAEKASILEQEYILKYNTTNANYGYNIEIGGLKNKQTSDETKQKISMALKGVKKPIKWHESRKRYYLTHEHPGTGRFGELSGNSQKVKCKETGDIFGSIQEAERWANSSKIGDCCRGDRKHAGKHPTTHEQLSWEYANKDAKVTITCPPNSPIAKSNVKRAFCQKVRCINTKQEFNSLTEAAAWCHLPNGMANISRCCKGERKSAGKHPETGEKL